jgi:hypothetical protein
MVMVFVTMMLTSFFTSHYLNRITASHHRATVLSFKGLAFNAAYGMIGLLYAGLITQLRHGVQGANAQWTLSLVEDEAFRRSISWFPWYLTIVLILVTLICWCHFRHAGGHLTATTTENEQ